MGLYRNEDRQEKLKDCLIRVSTMG
jgi:hypothetical protein